VIGSAGVTAGAVGATAESEVAVPDTDRFDPTGPVARTGAWITEAVPSVIVPRLHSRVVPFPEIADAGVTPLVLHTAGMLAKTAFVATRVARTLFTGTLAYGSFASLVLMCHSDVSACPNGADVGAGDPAQFAVISCTATVAALAAAANPRTEIAPTDNAAMTAVNRNFLVGRPVYQNQPRTQRGPACLPC
jgi:hypothetical protein